MTDYSHFDNTAVCGGSGLAVGSNGSEVTVSSSTGQLYQQGTAISASATVLNRTIGGTTSGYRIAAGIACASPSATVDTGLTTVTHAVVSVIGSCMGTAGTNGTLDLRNTTDARLTVGKCSAVQYRIKSTNDLWIKGYGPRLTSATLDSITKRTKFSWIAFGT